MNTLVFEAVLVLPPFRGGLPGGDVSGRMMEVRLLPPIGGSRGGGRRRRPGGGERQPVWRAIFINVVRKEIFLVAKQ